MSEIKAPKAKAQAKKSANTILTETLLLNRILQTDKSPARKTQKQIATKCKCGVQKVVRAEQIICELLLNKVNGLKILTKIN